MQVILQSLSVVEEYYQVQERWKQLKYIIPRAAWLIGMAGSLMGDEILLPDLHGTNNNLNSVCGEEVDVWTYIFGGFMEIL